MKRNGTLSMKILALEFSSDRRSVAIVEGTLGAVPALSKRGAQSAGNEQAKLPADSPVKMLAKEMESGARNLKGLVLVEAALRQAGLSPADIEAVAVGLGPGSYTGIRVAISMAQGWQLARNSPVTGISSVENLALLSWRQQMKGRIAIIIDAQRNEFYLAIYEMLADGPGIIEPLKLATLETVSHRLKDCDASIGPDVTRWFPGTRVLFPEADITAELALAQNHFAGAEQLEPIYLRETAFVKAPPPRRIE